jgi:hypothetical protein
MEMWLPELDNFKHIIIDHLAKPAHSIEMEYYNDIGVIDPPNQYVIQIDSVDDWRVFGFIDDMAVRTCRPGSGPVGPEDDPGRPHAWLLEYLGRG